MEQVVIGSYCTIGHGAILHSCTIKDRVLVGMNAIIQEGCIVEQDSMIAAGAVLLPESHVPEGQLWAGNPAKYVRDVTAEEIKFLPQSAEHYSKLARQHQEEFKPYDILYQQGELMGDTK
jgi:carbonic anhydrase/acetyltransferase-like protein (isoleucine patch superfamily)